MSTRYFFPNFVKAARNYDSDRLSFDFSKVDASVTAEASAVPTLLAIGSTEFSRAEAANAADRGEYLSPSKSELSESMKYRLIYGQYGLNSESEAYNVQSSDKWVFEINVQLTGTPNISVEKTLIEGNENEVGSKYELSVQAALPSSYSYLDRSVQEQLQQQILDSLQERYDDSKVKISKTDTGTYVMEILEEGEIEVSFSYSRAEYDGSEVSTSVNTSLTAVKGNSSTEDPISPSEEDQEETPSAEETKEPQNPPEADKEDQNENKNETKHDGKPGTSSQKPAAGENSSIGITNSNHPGGTGGSGESSEKHPADNTSSDKEQGVGLSKEPQKQEDERLNEQHKKKEDTKDQTKQQEDSDSNDLQEQKEEATVSNTPSAAWAVVEFPSEIEESLVDTDKNAGSLLESTQITEGISNIQQANETKWLFAGSAFCFLIGFFVMIAGFYKNIEKGRKE